MTDDLYSRAAEPLHLLSDWLEDAAGSEPNDPNAMALATVDAGGMPNVRVVLLKGIEANAILFYTNYESAKAQELASGKAAANFHWKTLRRQVRLRGHVTREDGPIADAYYASRSLGSRHGAWASQQSRPLDSRASLEAKVAAAAAKYGDNPPRPPFWGGFRLAPVELEFWADGKDRLHDRLQCTRPEAEGPWMRRWLNP